MSKILMQLNQDLAENPYVTFNSDDQGVSRVFDLTWDFHAKKQNTTEINFGHIDDKHRQNIQSYLYALVEWQKEHSSSGEHCAVGTLLEHRKSLTVIATRWGNSDFSLLSNEREWKKCSKKLEGYGAENTCNNLARSVNILNKIELISRYVSQEDSVKWIKNGAGDGQAIALPEAIYASILKQTIEFVETFYPYRHQISDIMVKVYAYQDDMLQVELDTLSLNHIDEMTVNQRACFTRRTNRDIYRWAAVRELQKALPCFKVNRQGHWLVALLKKCFMCVGLFSAARQNELMTMNKDSYSVTQSGVSKVSGFTTKKEHGNKIYTTWNTAPISKMALGLAYDATKATRQYALNKVEQGFQSGQLTKDKYDFKVQELSSSFIAADIPFSSSELQAKKNFKLSSIHELNLKEFNIIATEEDVAQFDLLNPSRAGDLKVGSGLPKLSPHDLRRSFVVFMVQNRLGNYLTVKYQLKHGNVNMSKWYANYSELNRTRDLLMDKELMGMFDELIHESVVDAFDDIYNESETLSGKEGERISKEKQECLRHGEQVLMTRSELEALVKSGDKSIVRLPTGGYCTNRNCERLCSLMDIVEAPCEHKVITDKAAKRLSKERDKLIASFKVVNDMGDYTDELILDAKKVKIQSIEPTLNAHKIPYEKFNDAIKVYGHENRI
ncbi:hypothetical protein [Moritella sp. F3]|uniref:hypothetical protein n=1 Tax=Moritella sp. F3 TaxID=2718882 RepID=UPI0018E0FC3A|nr:hypothetical protein [Moritella sp. F3]GIC75351.1 hypothetical protein FMO001_00780 [Moritella sp. F1]GIC80496.1 hypothetical protein FMO003_07770 [Moritella sp. F3]